jgi:hypothetical protein
MRHTAIGVGVIKYIALSIPLSILLYLFQTGMLPPVLRIVRYLGLFR